MPDYNAQLDANNARMLKIEETINNLPPAGGKPYVDGSARAAITPTPEQCMDYSIRKGNVSWSDSEIDGGTETKDKVFIAGNRILLIIPCNNGDVYFSFQDVVNRSLLTPTGVYWISKKGDPGKDGASGNDGKFELIETITATGEEMEIIRNFDKQYKAFMVVSEAPPTPNHYNYLFVMMGTDINNYASIGGIYLSSGSDYAMKLIVRPLMGTWDALGYNGNTSSASAALGPTSCQNIKFIGPINYQGTFPDIHWIRIYTFSETFVKGTVFKLYGVL